MKNNENEKAANSGKKPKYVKKIITETILKYKLLSFGIVAAVCLAVVFSLIPPLILAKIIDMFTAGQMPGLGMVNIPALYPKCVWQAQGLPLLDHQSQK